MREQFNVRPDAETWGRIRRLLPAVSAALGIKVSQADLLRLAMIELEKKYPPPAEPAGDPAPERGRRRRES